MIKVRSTRKRLVIERSQKLLVSSAGNSFYLLGFLLQRRETGGEQKKMRGEGVRGEEKTGGVACQKSTTPCHFAQVGSRISKSPERGRGTVN